LAAEVSDLFLINAFKLITSKDVGVAELALRDLHASQSRPESVEPQTTTRRSS
jgi:hypothetical protein